jgi:pimeloyl-ACP methyl ester carboxylesterase
VVLGVGVGWGWVLLKGMKQTSRHWVGVPEQLSARLDGAPVLTFDLPGTGGAADRRVPWSVPEMAQDVRARWLPERGRAERWGLLGLSLGGMVSISWADQHPDELQLVVIGNTSARGAAWPQERLWWRSWPALVRAIRTRDPVLRERRVLDLVCQTYGSGARDQLALRYAELTREEPFGLGAFARQLVAGSRYRAPKAIEVPLHVLSGARDTFVAPACSDRLARRFGAPLHRHPEAGHDLSLDAPEWLIDRLLFAMQSVDDQPQATSPPGRK